MTILTLTPVNLVAGGASPTSLTDNLTSIGSNTGIKFQNTGREVIAVVTTGTTTVTSDIGTTVQGQAVPGVSGGTLAGSKTYLLGPFPSQYDVQDGTNDVEIDFGTPANISGIACLHLPGVI